MCTPWGSHENTRRGSYFFNTPGISGKEGAGKYGYSPFKQVVAGCSLGAGENLSEYAKIPRQRLRDALRPYRRQRGRVGISTSREQRRGESGIPAIRRTLVSISRTSAASLLRASARRGAQPITLFKSVHTDNPEHFDIPRYPDSINGTSAASSLRAIARRKSAIHLLKSGPGFYGHRMPTDIQVAKLQVPCL